MLKTDVFEYLYLRSIKKNSVIALVHKKLPASLEKNKINLIALFWEKAIEEKQ